MTTGGDDGSTTSVSRAKHQTLSGLSALAGQAAIVEAALDQRVESLRGSIRERAEVANRTLQMYAGQQRTALEEQLRIETLRSRALLHNAISDAAPGLAAANWGSSTWGTPPVGDAMAAALRIGSHSDTGAAALLPVSAVPGWRITGEDAREFIAEIVVRAALAFPPEGFELTVFDPRVRGVVGFTSLLRKDFPEHFRPAIHHEEALVTHLNHLLARLSEVAEKMSLSGVTSFSELASGERGPHHFVVVLDAPAGLSGHGADALERLIGGCAGRGVTVLVETPGRPTGPVPLEGDEEFDPDGRMVCLDVSATSIQTSVRELGPVRRDRALTTSQRNNAMVAWLEAISAQADRSMTLSSLLGDRPVQWSDRGVDRLTARIGRAGGSTLELMLSGANPATPNVLIGGATGSGKSNLLLALIYSLSHRHSPRDLQMYLLDFKEGIEFAQLAPEDGDDWLPHVAVLGLESDRSYGIAVLQHLVEEFDRRAAEFKAVRATSVSSYRELSGQDMPRLVVVADEFQVLFEPDDAQAQRAVELLEKLARKGRAYGIHLVLASQTLSGIQALGTKRESIFAQFHHRISLKNTIAESESILGYGNLAAADLTGRGRVIVNSELGRPDANITGTVVWAEPTHLNELRGRLWRRHREEVGTSRRPESFTSSSFSTWSGTHAESVAAVGVPVGVAPTVEGFSMEHGNPGCIGVIGADDQVVNAVTASLAVSILGSARAEGARVSFVDTSDRAVGGGLRDLVSDIDGPTDSVEVSCVGADRAGEFLLSLTNSHEERTSRIDHVVIVDDIAVIDGFGENGPFDHDGFCAEFRLLLTRAASRGVLMVVRFRSVAAFTSLGMFGFSSDISRLVLTTGQNDATRIDPTIRVDDAWPRATLVDTERGQWRSVVPFDPGTLTGGGVR